MFKLMIVSSLLADLLLRLGYGDVHGDRALVGAPVHDAVELLLGLGDVLGVLEHLHGGGRHDLAAVDHALVADGHAGAGGDLPAVAGGPGGEAEGGELSRGGEPAHVPHVGGAGRKILAAVIGQEEIVEGLLPPIAHGPHRLRDGRVLFRPQAGEGFGGLVSPPQGGGEGGGKANGVSHGGSV